MNTALPDVQSAYSHLFDAVRARVFFNKCAAAGYSPRTQDEAAQMLKIAGDLRRCVEAESEKKASAAGGLLGQMSSSLSAVMAQHGFAAPAPAEVAHGYKQAADELMSDPAIYNSVLALKAAEAETIAAEFEAAGHK